MNMQKDERIFQAKMKQAGIADLSDEQAGVYELSDEQLELVRGSDGGSNDPTGGLFSGLSGLTGKNSPVGSLLGGL